VLREVRAERVPDIGLGSIAHIDALHARLEKRLEDLKLERQT
jgi:hypothetical protein